MSFSKTSRGLTAAFALNLALITPALAGDILISDAFARGSGAKTGTGAAFMEITNSGDQDDRLIAASAERARKTELHTHIHGEDGVMKMREDKDGFEIPAGGSALLKRGGDHVMMMGLQEKLEQDEVILITLTFEKAGEMTVEIPVDLNR